MGSGQNFIQGIFYGFLKMCVLYSTLLHLPPLRFHCVITKYLHVAVVITHRLYVAQGRNTSVRDTLSKGRIV
jgi:hypothetical protein